MAIPSQFNNQNYLSLETRRKNGEVIATPVWFVEQDGKLLVKPQTTAGKTKRIRNNGSVRIAPSDARGGLKGEYVPAQAKILPPAANTNLGFFYCDVRMA